MGSEDLIHDRLPDTVNRPQLNGPLEVDASGPVVWAASVLGSET